MLSIFERELRGEGVLSSSDSCNISIIVVPGCLISATFEAFSLQTSSAETTMATMSKPCITSILCHFLAWGERWRLGGLAEL